MALPCGCAVADYRAPVLEVEMVSLEGSDPHCHLNHHGVEDVIDLNELGELDTRLMVEQRAE